MIEIINKYWFPVVLISLWGVFFYLKIREKKKFRNEITGDFISNTQVTLVNPAFVEASTRMIEREEEPTKEFVNEVIKLIKVVLSEHSIQDDTFGYIYPWYLLNINRAEFRFRIYKDYFILKKGTKETTSKLNKDDITQALKTIGVLKG